jgi:serine/threonine protein phosphatase 1
MTIGSEARTIAIGDIHGCALALRAILEAVRPRPSDLIVPLGDYVDRGPDSRGVLERMLQLRRECMVVPIMGNHDEMLLQARGGHHPTTWLGVGGLATLASYGAGADLDPAIIPYEHIAFLESCVAFYETETHIFLHASYLPHLPMSEQPSLALYWESLREGVPDPHKSGKTVIAGHTSQRSGEILNLGHLICIDTCCYGGGWLTALDVGSGQVWQADREGRMRS